MELERRYQFGALMDRLTSDAWAVGRIKKQDGRIAYFFLPAGYRDYALFWRNRHGL